MTHPVQTATPFVTAARDAACGPSVTTCAPPPTILHRDDFLVVVDKPSGLLVHRGWANDRVTMLSLVRDAVGRRVYPVHRLDRGTSGVLVLALDAATAAQLQLQFKAGAVIKNYLAFSRGLVPSLGLIDHALRKSSQHEPRRALTAIRRLAAFERYSLVEARTFTGRQHQIRRHLKHIAHPIIGDVRYGKGEHNRKFREELSLWRLCLHATKIRLLHPETWAPLEFHAPLPRDLALPFEKMGLLEPARGAAEGDVWAPELVDVPPLSRAAGCHSFQAGFAEVVS